MAPCQTKDVEAGLYLRRVRRAGQEWEGMEENIFTDVAAPGWWLLQIQLDPPLDSQRTTLGQYWGWKEEDWYQKPENLTRVFQFLTNERSDLHRELDDLLLNEQTNGIDAFKRSEWLTKMLEAKKPPEEPAKARSDHVPDSPTVKPQDKVAEKPAAPPKKPSAFGSKQKPVAEPANSVENITASLSQLADKGVLSKEDMAELAKDANLGADLAAAEAELQAELQAELEAELASVEAEE
jgi:hypothetical protein